MNNHMMVVASHQPHFFPWLGYFDKMAKVDLFLINDIAQLEKKSPMTRNKIVDNLGTERFINVVVDKTDFMKKQNREIVLRDWDKTRESIKGKIKDCYFHAKYYNEIWPYVDELLGKNYTKLIDVDIMTIEIGRQCFGIKTPLSFQSDLVFKNGETKSEKLSEKLYAVKADVYLSGNGGKKYINLSDFSKKGIKVVFQSFSYPVYPQMGGGKFLPNLSFLDLLFNCGIMESRKIFWSNVNSSNELGLL